MTVTVQLFAGAREAAGADELSVQAPRGATYAELASLMGQRWPALLPLLKNTRFAADAEYVDPTEVIRESAQIALIPPVSGG